MISLYRHDANFANEIENYFLIWIENKEFQKELEKEGFDITLENLKKSKHVFRNYMDYFSAIERKIESIRQGEDTISHEMQIFLGSMLLSSEPKYQRLWMDLCFKLPGMQQSLDDYIKNINKGYQEFKKNFKKQHHLKTKLQGR